MADEIFNTWAAGVRNVCAVLPTGGGKTHVAAHIIKTLNTDTWVIAHRKEIITQISGAMARSEVPHKMVASDDTIKLAIRGNIRKYGKDWYDPSSKVVVSSINTLVNRREQMAWAAKHVRLWVTDECHHLLRGNMWGKGIEIIPDAKGLGLTAVPYRTDGKGLGRKASGVMDALVVGPSMSELIDRGYLSPYRIWCPPTQHLNLADVPVGASGDYSPSKLKTAVRKSTIVGDVVATYKKYAMGKLGLTFATDVETATDLANAYRNAGVPAEVVTAKTPVALRDEIFQKLEARDIWQVVNVDILGEGFDCPAVEVGSFARPTESLNLYRQQFGRILRPMPGKTAFIFDHVGNVMRHLPPSRPIEWTLLGRDKKPTKASGPPVKICINCTGVYEAYERQCPYCGYAPQPAGRSKPEYVEGDLTEMDDALIRALSGEIARVDAPDYAVRDRMLAAGANKVVAYGAAKQHRMRQEAQARLRAVIAQWAGWQRYYGFSDSQSYRLFYHLFGMDVLTAQTLGRPEAERLSASIEGNYERI